MNEAEGSEAPKLAELTFSELPFSSLSKRVFMQNRSYENLFRQEVHFHVNQTPFHMKGFAIRLVLKLRHKVPRKWPIVRRVF